MLKKWKKLFGEWIVASKFKNSNKIVETTIPPTTNPAIVSSSPRIVKIIGVGESANSRNKKSVVESKDFLSIAKTLQPGCAAVTGIFNRTTVKFVALASESVLENPEQAEKIAAKVGWSDQTQSDLNGALSRIIAKRFPETDFMDFAIVTAAVGEMGLGLTAVVKELVAIRKMKIEEMKNQNKIVK